MGSWDKFKNDLLTRNPEVKAEYDRLGPRYATITALIKARNAAKVTQSELARRMNVAPNTVSRLESAEHSPRIDTLASAATAMGYELQVRFVKRPGPSSHPSTAAKRAKSRAK